MKIFVPVPESLPSALMEQLGVDSLHLVPFQLDYQCLRLGVGHGSGGADVPAPEAADMAAVRAVGGAADA